MALTPTPPSARQSQRLRDLSVGALEPTGGFTVVVYALTTYDHVPTNTLNHVRAYASSQGWRVHRESLWDGSGLPHPLERTSWQRALELVAGGFVQGIVTLTRSAVSTSDGEYEESLDLLATYRSFLAHVPCDWTPIASTAVRAVEDCDV
ncbi:hypothetical protein [Streptomyces sp. NPDC005408]|uniref:hypothetical protein n=1 Tax=Streptomyces sp. NPDC005408 TaxID=3155341 RepID=UPI0033A7A4B5